MNSPKGIQARLLIGVILCGVASAWLLLAAWVSDNSVLTVLCALLTVAATACLLALGSVYAKWRTARRWIILELLLTAVATAAMIAGLCGYAFAIVTESYDFDDWATMAWGTGLLMFTLAFCLVQWQILWLLQLHSMVGKWMRWIAVASAWALVQWIMWEIVYLHGPWDVNETLAGVVLPSAICAELIAIVLHTKRYGLRVKRAFAYTAIFSAFVLLVMIWNMDLVVLVLDAAIGDAMAALDERSLMGVFVVLAMTAAVALVSFWESVQRQADHGSIGHERVAIRMDCPRCAYQQEILSSESNQCARCGLRIQVNLTDPRCDCGYLLFQAPGQTCPECGRKMANSRAAQLDGLSGEETQAGSALTARSANPGVRQEP